MNEEAIKDSYDLFVADGYNGNFDEFKNLLATNPNALKDSYNLFVADGYANTIEDYKSLIGIGGKSTPVKKKFALDSSSGNGSSELPKSNKTRGNMPTLNDPGVMESVKKSLKNATSKDATGQPIVKPQIDKALKATFDKINNKVGSDKRISKTLGKINSNFIGKEEEEVVSELSKDQTLKDLGFTFEESGAGDYLTVTAPNGKTTEISLDNFFESKSARQALALQKFIKDNTSKEKRIELDKIVLKEEFENKQIQDKKKKLGDIFDKQLGSKPKVEDSAYLKERLASIDTDLINETQENVVAEMQYQFGDLGFKFEETGVLGDYMKVTAPNGKTAEISLDNFLDSKSTKQAELLKGFIKTNTPAKGLFVLERTQKEEDKKFNSQKQVDDSIKSFSKELNDLNARQKQFLAKKAQLEKQIKQNGLTQELQNQGIALNEEMKTLLSEEESIQYKSRKLDAAVGKYTIMESKKGTTAGAFLNEFLLGVGDVLSGITNLATDIYVERTPTEKLLLEKDLKEETVRLSKKLGVKPPTENQSIAEWKKTLTEEQIDNWEDEIDDYAKKDFKKEMLPLLRIGGKEVFGDRETTQQFADLKKEGFWGGAILGLARSLPAMAGGPGVAGVVQRTAQMYAQVSDGLAQEMENDPDFKDVSENEKLAITLPIGIVGAVLENVGLKNIKGSQGLINNITLRVLGKAGKGVTAKTFRELVENEVDGMIAKGVLTVTAAGAAEFETGAAQELSNITFKTVYNKLRGEVDPITGEQKKMFDTPDSIGDLVENVVVSGLQEAVGGFVLGVPTAVSVAYTKKGFLKMDDDSFKAFESMANDDNMQTAYVTSLKNQITRGIITIAEAKTQLNEYRNASGLYRQLPEGLNTQQKKEAMNLLKEKRDLQNYVEGKDNALVVKQKERITEIDNELTKLSETDAVQEQSTTEIPVQSETTTSETMETGVPGPGPEVVTEQVKEEEVVEEPTIKDSQIPLKRETFEVELDNGATTNVEVTTNKDGSRQIVTKADGFISEGDNIDKDNTLSTEEYITKAYGEIKGEPTVEQGVDVMAPAMKDKLTGQQKSELGIEEEVAPTEVITEQVETAPIVEDSQPKKEQWEIDFERIEGKLNEFNAENRPLALEKERVSLSERKNSEERIKLQDELFNAQKNISRADDADLAIEEYNKKKQELEEFDKETQNIVDYKKVNDIIRQEIEWKEQDADRYDFPEEFNKDPREAALKRIKEWVDGFNETLDENDLEQKNRYENEIKILEQDIKDNPLKENTLLREPKEEVAPAEVVTEQVETAPVVETNELAYIKTSEKGRNFILTEDLKINFPKLYKRLISKYSNTAWDSSDIRNAIVALTSQKPRTKAGMTDLIDSQIEAERLLIELDQKADSITKQELLDKIDAKEGYTESQKKTLKDIVEALKGDEFFDFTDNLKSQDAYSFADNLLKAKNADTFVHEVGHWGFYNLLSSEDRIAYLNYVKEKFYGTGTKMSDDIALTREVLFGDGSKMTTNSEDDFSEYFAEQFRQYVFSNKTDKQLESIFDRFKKYLLEIVEQFRKKGYNKDLQPFFDKIIKENKADATSVTEEVKDLLNVDTKDKAGLERVLDYLNKADAALDLDPNELNDVTRVMATATAKAVIKALKALVNAGITLQEAIKRVSAEQNVTPEQIIDAMNIVSKINEKAPDSKEISKKINASKGKLKNAKKNIVTKLGVADGLIVPLQQLFNINPKLIPAQYLDRYLELVNMFGERRQVLSLEEKSVVIKDVNEILSEIDNETSKADELAYRFELSENKVFNEDGTLNYAESIKKMFKEGEIDSDELDLMTKYKKQIAPQVEKEKRTEQEIQEEKESLIKEIKNATINSDGLVLRDERNAAKKIAELIKGKAIEALSNVELKNLIKVIDNINNGYLPHYAQLIKEKLNAQPKASLFRNAVNRAKALPISMLYSRFKSKLTGKDSVLELIRRNPLFYIDQVFGDFKTKDFFNSILRDSAEAEAKYSSDLKKIQDRLDKALNKVSSSFNKNGNKVVMSKYKMMTYMLQLEYESNEGNKEVNPASEYLKATIKKIATLKSKFNERDSKMLQEILKEYSTDGEIDNKKLYNSFNSAEKEAIKTIREVNESLTEKAVYTSAVIRGQRINPLTNYIHLNVINDNGRVDEEASLMNNFNDSRKPSTKAKSLIERTRGAKAIDFDVFSSVNRGVKGVLLDYHLTEPIRTARKTINTAVSQLESEGPISKEKRKIINAIEGAFEESVSNMLETSYTSTSLGNEIVDFISKQGYRTVLAGTGRFVSEFISNAGFVLNSDPTTFAEGLKHMGTMMSSKGPAVMNNVSSTETNRIYPSDQLSGRLIDGNILSQTSGERGSTSSNPVFNKARQIWNLTGKKFVKNPVELTSDFLISTPDKAIMRPVWFGAFASQFKKETGSDVDFNKIAENDETYMNDNKDAIEKSKIKADERSIITGASKNAFTGMLKGTNKVTNTVTERAFNNFNNFMSTFLIYEFITARTGVMSAMGKGALTRKQGVALLSGVVTRMTVYSLMTKALGAGLVGLVAGGDDEEEEKKSLDKAVGQALASTFTSLLLGRDFGNATKTIINLGVENFNENYLQGLREGEYDPYEDAIQFTAIPPEKEGKERNISDFIIGFSGSYQPMVKTLDLAVKKGLSKDKKTPEAQERLDKEKYVRLPLEILGNLGLVPLYKEVRKTVMEDMYKGIKKDKKDKELKAEETADKKEESRIQKERALKEVMDRYPSNAVKEAAKELLNDLNAESEEDKKLLKEERAIEKEEKKALLIDPKTGTVYDNETELKRYNPILWKKNFGPYSEWYKKHRAEELAKKAMNKEIRKEEDKEYKYIRKSKTKKNRDGTSKRTYSYKKTQSQDGSSTSTYNYSSTNADGSFKKRRSKTKRN